MLALKSKKGFTLVEIILVVLIIGFLAAIIIPRITYTSNEARRAACNATVSTINSMIEYALVRDNVAYPATAAAFTAFLACVTYFPDQPTACPVNAACTYTYCITTSRCLRHAH